MNRRSRLPAPNNEEIQQARHNGDDVRLRVISSNISPSRAQQRRHCTDQRPNRRFRYWDCRHILHIGMPSASEGAVSNPDVRHHHLPHGFNNQCRLIRGQASYPRCALFATRMTRQKCEHMSASSKFQFFAATSPQVFRMVLHSQQQRLQPGWCALLSPFHQC